MKRYNKYVVSIVTRQNECYNVPVYARNVTEAERAVYKGYGEIEITEVNQVEGGGLK